MGALFWTPGTPPPAGGGIGMAVHGLASADAAFPLGTPGSAAFPAEGEVLAGSPCEVVERLRSSRVRPRAAIVLATRARGIEPVLAALHALHPGLPAIGGGACRLDAAGRAGESGASLDGGEVEVLLLTSGDWRAETLVVHGIAGPPVEAEADGPRRIRRLRVADDVWRPAAEVFAAWQRVNGAAPGDRESVTVADRDGRTLHLAPDGDALACGSDLPADGRLVLRAAPRGTIPAQVAAFCAVPDALVCACAGLGGLLPELPRPGPGSVLAFCWGEIAPLAGRPVFANLLCARLRRA